MLMATEKPARIHLKARHPITGRKPFYRDWWFEHEGVVFRISADWLRSTVWTIQPDIDHLDGRGQLQFVESPAYWVSVALGLEDARHQLATFIASPQFAELRDVYNALSSQAPNRNR
ncbi:hypothetical protein [Nonomuraea sp. NPDC050202]|uniref:hypothetical protein n=1 Tax=Nonomuraea sp. NPDC050202 TaxID=3155035 RepID=UPI0033E0EF80